MEQNVIESQYRAVVYLDLLGFAALVEATPQFFEMDILEASSNKMSPPNSAAQRLALFHQVLEGNNAHEQPNHAMVFSDCAFAVFYTPPACAAFAVSIQRCFLETKVPVRMGLGYGTFGAMGTTSEIKKRSTVVRSIFGGTSIIRAVFAESCGGKGMRIFAHDSFSEVFDRCSGGPRNRLLPTPHQLKSVSYELDFVSGSNSETISEYTAGIREMARLAPHDVQEHYSETLAAMSRMVGA